MTLKRTLRKKMPLRYSPETHIKTRPLAFIDLEFTGLAADHEILQIAAVMVHQPDFSVVSEWQTRVKSTHLENADKKALKLVGYTTAKWKDAIPLRDALEQFNEIAKDAVLVGFNVVGDFYQLKKSYHQVGLLPAYHWQVLDVQSMIFSELYRSKMNGFRMREVVKYFRLKNADWHDALADSRATYEIFMKLMQRIHE